MKAKSPPFLQLLGSPAAAGVFTVTPEIANDVFQGAAEIGFNVWRIDISPVRDSRELLSVLGSTLRFPDWYGHNWDALADCLTDLSWCEADGHILLIPGLAGLQQRDPSACQKLLGLLQEVSFLWREDGVAFWVLFEHSETADLCKLQPLPVPAGQ